MQFGQERTCQRTQTASHCVVPSGGRRRVAIDAPITFRATIVQPGGTIAKLLFHLRGETDSVLEVVGCVGPTVVLQGEITDAATQLAAAVAGAYSDADAVEVGVIYRSMGTEREIRVARPDRFILQPHAV
jgi:hypothetical protein